MYKDGFLMNLCLLNKKKNVDMLLCCGYKGVLRHVKKEEAATFCVYDYSFSTKEVKEKELKVFVKKQAL